VVAIAQLVNKNIKSNKNNPKPNFFIVSVPYFISARRYFPFPASLFHLVASLIEQPLCREGKERTKIWIFLWMLFQ